MAQFLTVFKTPAQMLLRTRKDFSDHLHELATPLCSLSTFLHSEFPLCTYHHPTFAAAAVAFLNSPSPITRMEAP